MSPFVGAFMLYTAQPKVQCKTQLLLVVLQCVKHNMGIYMLNHSCIVHSTYGTVLVQQ